MPNMEGEGKETIMKSKIIVARVRERRKQMENIK